MMGDSFETYRPKLFAVAYRMLGSASEAEDAVQDAWLRYATSERSDVRSPEAFLTTIVTRLCLDRLKSARASREQYVGPWLPEPILTDERPGPETAAALAESVSLAFMVLLETLSPEERAAFLLREVFEYDSREIGDMLKMSPENARQLVHRAKTRLGDRRAHVRATTVDHDRKRSIVERFASALRDGDKDALTEVLADDVVLVSDGGGKVSAARRPLVGRAEVLGLLIGIRRIATSEGIDLNRIRLDVVDVNGDPAVSIRIDGRVDSIYTCSFDGETISAFRIVRNPDKLQYIGRQLIADCGSRIAD
jgi:RNA polymerase sigma-70 factor (ECF subfamily)